VVNAPVALNQGDKQYVLLMSVLLDNKGNTSDITFIYNDRKAQYIGDTLSVTAFSNLITNTLGQYIEKIEPHLPDSSPNDVIRIFGNMKRVNIGDTTFDL